MKSFSWLLLAFLLAQNLHAQTTGFNYHGNLMDNGNPANGTNYGMIFSLCDATSNGNQLSNVSIANVSVSNGLFTVPLDFGSNFPGADRWLEISVQKDGGTFITLSPRQKINPTPYAITAANLSGSLPAVQITGVIPASSIAGNFIQQANGTGTGTHLTDAALFGDASAYQTYIVNQGTHNGSTLGLVNLAHTGYSDINFYDTGYIDGNNVVQPVSLRGALGVGSSWADQFPYNFPYWECYGQNPFYFVQYAQIFGGVNGTNGDFVWYRFKTSQADESTKMFEIVRKRTNITSFVPIIISNTPAGPPASDIGANQAAAIWVSNGVVYARTSTDGMNTSDKQIAP